ncbi:hypothetical protein JOF56_009944 [Kibdelosporangium banguiense]|uniref:Lasso RiPP family leader peptide-containing protein n=1 Tax=Kibdelosporangium banguiense TaxID=1365924 RepID=A0ABS4U011_9PSEU|nr:hypothetical protein [Kibdelosporangium banguiense]
MRIYERPTLSRVGKFTQKTAGSSGIRKELIGNRL